MGFKRRGGGRKPRASWQTIERENAQWEDFYKAQNLPDASEFEAFKASLQQDLPMTFRITGSAKNSKEVQKMIEEKYVSGLQGLEFNDELLVPPAPIPFYPERMAWQVDAPKHVIRRNPDFAKFQRFLVVETAVGNISRQEAVSMIPTLFMDVQPHHNVLDTCASPGSKTAQLIEALHRDGQHPTGIVVANDADYRRSHMLTHQVKRLNSANVLITNHDAQLYPKISIGPNNYLKFDRILCDVPCSGDGTMRKNVNVWKDWSVGNGLGLHQLQVNIGARGLQMLKPGGRLVYSTCSLNPLEDEAVVAQLLRQFPSVQLVDVSTEYPELIRSPGTTSWKVMAKDKTWQDPETTTLARSLFPPTEDEIERFRLDRTMRIYPHQQNTGGFYVAVLEKAAAEPTQKKAKVETASDESVAPATGEIPTGDGSTGADQKIKSNKLPRDAMEEPFHFLSPDHPTVEAIWNFFEIKDFARDALVVRNQTGEPVRTIYYVAPPIKTILQLNENKLKFIHTGVKLFAQQKNEGPIQWRIQSEGTSLIAPFLGAPRRVTTDKIETLKFLSQRDFPKFNELEEVDKELHDQIKALSEGCCLLELGGANYPLWRGRASLNIMSPKENTEEILLRVFDISQPGPRGQQKKPSGGNEHRLNANDQNGGETNDEPVADVNGDAEVVTEEVAEEAVPEV